MGFGGDMFGKRDEEALHKNIAEINKEIRMDKLYFEVQSKNYILEQRIKDLEKKFEALETKKDQCNHEPFMTSLQEVQSVPCRMFYRKQELTDLASMFCKHCGVKIKAEKWVEE